MTRLTVVIILDILLINAYVWFVKLNALDIFMITKYSYELLLMLVGVLGINNAYLVRSRILLTIGLCLIVFGLYNIARNYGKI